MLDYKVGELALGKMMQSYSTLSVDSLIVKFEELFNADDLQKLQDQFSDAFGVASIITHPNGQPITNPSNFSRLCEHIIRCTEKGRLNCMHSDAILGRHHPEGPVVQPCLSGGLWDAGASITVGGKHVASWLIGQVRSHVHEDEKMLEYAREIGANEEEFITAFREIPVMPHDQFQKVAKMLFTMAGQLSDMAYQNLQQAKIIHEREQAELALKEKKDHLQLSLKINNASVFENNIQTGEAFSTPELYEFLGYSEDEVPATIEQAVKFIHSDDMPLVIKAFNEHLTGTAPEYYSEFRMKTKAGGWRWVDGRGQIVEKDDHGNPVLLLGISRDIHFRKVTEEVLRIQEESYRTTLYSIGDGVITTDNHGKVEIINLVAEELTGWSQADAMGKPLEEVFNIINEYTREPVEIPVRKVLREGAIVGLANHTLLIAKDGTERPITDSGAPIKNEKGEIVGVVLVFRDQTEDREAEKALRESEVRFRSIIESSPIGNYIYQLQDDGQLIFRGANPSADRIIGIDHHTLIGKTIQQAFPKLAPTEVPEMYARIAKGEIGTQSFEIEYSENDINGFFQVTVFSIGNDSIAVDFLDISDRKKAEIALRENEEKFRSLFENATVGISMTTIDGTMTINERMHEMLGYTEAEFRNKKWQEITHPDDIKKGQDAIYKLLNGQARQLRFEKRYLHKNGNIVWTDVSTTLHHDEKDQADFFITSISDITDRKEAEKNLRRNERKFRALIENSSDAISLVDANGIEFYHSSSCHQILGYSAEERNGKSMMELIHPDDIESVINMFTEILKNPGVANLLPTRVRRNDGLWIWIEGVANNLLADPDIQAIVINFRDISERKNAEQALFESEEMMRNSQAVAHICSYSTILNLNDIGKSVWRCSPEFYNIFGIDKSYPHTIEGWAGFIHPDFREEIVAYHENVIKEKIPFEHEYKIMRINDGAVRWVYGTGKLELDEKGNPIRMHGAIQDITERKLNLEAIHNERQLLRKLIDNLPVTIYVKDSNGRKLVANKADLEVIGVETEAEVLGKTDLEIFSDEISQRGYEDDMKIIHTQEPVINREEIFIDKNGVQRCLLTSKIPIIDLQGKTTGLVGIGRDITEQKKASETIHKLTKSIEQNPSSIIITDTLGNIEYVNPKFTEITGYTFEELKGQNPRILKSGEMTAEDYKNIWDTISSGEVWRSEFHNRRKDGELYWEWATMTSIKNEQGEITNYIAIKEDISLRKQMEADLIVAKEKAEESDRLKSAFLANMSHEIRTPLNSIIGFSELLTDPAFEVDQKTEFINHIITNGNNLLNIISDIVDISKIESGEITIRNSVIPVKSLLNNIRDIHLPKVEEKNLQLKCICSFPEECTKSVFADKERLYQIFNNLISNALKFTSKGYIEIGCRQVGEMIEFQVSDTGIGIPPDYHHKIFDRFRQVEASYTRKFGGNGLGLAISKNLVELMGGAIWVESEVGKGSTFYFTLPLYLNTF